MTKQISNLSFFERSGLLALIGVIAFFLWFRASYLHEKTFHLNDELIAHADSLSLRLEASKYDHQSRFQSANFQNDNKLTLSAFDPNLVNEVEMRNMNFPEKLIRNIINYRNKVGSFKSVDDFSRLYALDQSLFFQIRPYLAIQVNNTDVPKKELELKEESVVDLTEDIPLIELNTADSLDLLSIKGIGPFYASKILKFRDALGGFLAVDQVKDTYHLPDSVFAKIRAHLHVDQKQIKKINLNLAAQKELSAHPYLTWKEARAIIRYREQHGSFEEVQDIKKILALKSETIHRIIPYLKV
jgi:competence protein ComEA